MSKIRLSECASEDRPIAMMDSDGRRDRNRVSVTTGVPAVAGRCLGATSLSFPRAARSTRSIPRSSNGLLRVISLTAVAALEKERPIR